MKQFVLFGMKEAFDKAGNMIPGEIVHIPCYSHEVNKLAKLMKDNENDHEFQSLWTGPLSKRFKMVSGEALKKREKSNAAEAKRIKASVDKKESDNKAREAVLAKMSGSVISLCEISNIDVLVFKNYKSKEISSKQVNAYIKKQK
jgi:hypothetical protein